MNKAQVFDRYQRRIALLARRLAERLPPHTELEMQDLVGFGALGLLEAFERYDPSRNILFSTFAEYRIRGAMMDALRQNDTFTRYRRQLSKRIQESEHVLTLELGRPPEPEEVAGRLGMDLESYWQARDQVMPVKRVSIDNRDDGDGEDEGHSLGEMLVGTDGEEAYRSILNQQARARLKQAITDLPERKRQMVLLYYGRGMNLAEIAAVFQVTPSRVSQILSAARKALKADLATDLSWGDLVVQEQRLAL